MEPFDQGRAAERTGRCRCALEYTIGGDLRFISHRDTLRLFQRAVARAALPVRFTEGFNPHPRMMIPLPRPVGVASQAETLVGSHVIPCEAVPAVAVMQVSYISQCVSLWSQ